MTVIYLEVDDEITGAITRIRAVRDGEAIIVVPPGSRIATSRINFKLLVREAGERRLNIAAVGDEPSVRALAISAGLPAYDSLAAAEKALATFRDQDRRLAERLGRRPTDAVAARDPNDTRVMPVPAGARGAAGVGAGSPYRAGREQAPDSAETLNTRRRRIGLLPLAVATLLVLLLAGVGYGAYLFLPTATITLRPLASELRLEPFVVTADPDVAVADVAEGVVPAQWIELEVSATGSFAATGVETRETRATGVVRFRSENTVNDVPLLAGTIVSTPRGTEFETTAPANVPRADFATSTPGTVDVPVRAVRPGPQGNVDADAITELPAELRALQVTVRNVEPTTGGRRTEQTVVSQEDYDAAVAALTARLGQALALRLADPASTPRGLSVYPDSARPGEAVADQASAEMVGSPIASFTLTLSSVATVLALNETLIDDLAAARLRAGLPSGQQLVGEVISVGRSSGRVVGETVVYDVAPTASVYVEPDREDLIAQLRGKSVDDAQRILSAYGMVDIVMWPEFIDRLPDQPARISLVVVAPSASPRP